MSARLRLFDRRASLTFDFELAGLRYTTTVSRFPDGKLAEVFIGNHKAGSTADTVARDAAIACSLALQHGADVEVIRRAPHTQHQRQRLRAAGRRARHHCEGTKMTMPTVIMTYVNPLLRCPCGRTLQGGDLRIDDGLVRIDCPRCNRELVEVLFPTAAELELEFAPREKSGEEK
jgi:hypothetical protein